MKMCSVLDKGISPLQEVVNCDYHETLYMETLLCLLLLTALVWLLNREFEIRFVENTYT